MRMSDWISDVCSSDLYYALYPVMRGKRALDMRHHCLPRNRDQPFYRCTVILRQLIGALTTTRQNDRSDAPALFHDRLIPNGNGADERPLIRPPRSLRRSGDHRLV